MHQMYNLNRDYHELPNKINIEGKEYFVTCAIDLYFNIEKNFDCISGDILDVTDVLVDVYDITLSIDGEEMPQEMITEEVELWVENQIDWRDYETRMIEKYLEDR